MTKLSRRKEKSMISVFDYTSYREFLWDYYREQKQVNPNFSYQYFADKAGFKTKTFIPKVLNGEKALAKRSTINIAKAVRFKKRETDYFETLVSFNNAKSTDEKEFYFQRLQALSKSHKSSTIRESQFSYFAHWYNLVIRELVTILDWDDDYSILAKAVYPPITPRKAEIAVKLLIELGMIKKMPSGRYIQVDKAITTGDQVTSLAVSKYQKQTMELAIESLNNIKKVARDVSTMTVGISPKGFEKIKEEIKLCRGRIREIVLKDKACDRVYQINFQVFPLSKLPKNKESE